jgi:hypothetical protein
MAGCGNSSTDNPNTPSSGGLNFQGQFTGTYNIVACGEFSGTPCGAPSYAGFNVGTALPINLAFIQNGTAVSGTVTLGQLSGSFQGSVQAAGNLSGTATMNLLVITGVPNPQYTTYMVTANNWDTTLVGNQLTGGFHLTFDNTKVTEDGVMAAVLLQVSRK